MSQQLHELVLLSARPDWRLSVFDNVPEQKFQLCAWHSSGLGATVDVPWNEISAQFGQEFKEQVTAIRQQQHEAAQKMTILFEVWLRARVAQNREPGHQDNGN